MSTPVRLNKFISESGVCSRREADRYIEQGNVKINGKRAKIGDQVFPGDIVHVNGNALEPMEAIEHVYIALNKPTGITSTTELSDRTNIIDFVNHSRRIFPVGRLDKDSQGLIFLTSDGDIVNRILRASNNHEKEYLVTVNKPITPEFIEGMSAGVPILGKRTKRCKINAETPYIFRIILVQGLNRQIRRMCEHFGYEVTKLERIRIMNVTLKGLPQGDWRDLTQDELKGIFKLLDYADHQKKNAEKSQQRATESTGEKKNFNGEKKLFSKEKKSFTPKHKSAHRGNKPPQKGGGKKFKGRGR
jgi:23S rRNA pseudouridine2604 synthase